MSIVLRPIVLENTADGGNRVTSGVTQSRSVCLASVLLHRQEKRGRCKFTRCVDDLRDNSGLTFLGKRLLTDCQPMLFKHRPDCIKDRIKRGVTVAKVRIGGVFLDVLQFPKCCDKR